MSSLIADGRVSIPSGARLAEAAGLAAIAFLLAPIASLLIAGLTGGVPSALNSAFTASDSWHSLAEPAANSLIFAASSAFSACALAAFYAAIVAWTDIVGRRILSAMVLLPLFLPPMIYAFAWVLLAGPNGGMINQATGLRLADIYSMPGLVWVETLNCVPVLFLLFSGVFRTIPAATFEVARLTGASRLVVFRRVVFPAVRPAIVAGFLIVFIRALGTFEVPAIIGTPAGLELISTRIYSALQTDLDDLSPVAAFAGAIVVLTITLLFFEKRLSARRYQHSIELGSALRFELGRARGPLSLMVLAITGAVTVLPIYALWLRSVTPRLDAAWFWWPLSRGIPWTGENYAALMQDPAIWAALGRSLLWATLAAILLSVLSVLLVWSSLRLRSMMATRIILLSHVIFALPGIVIGIAILVLASHLRWLSYVPGVLILIVYAVRGMPYALVYSQRALQRVSGDLWDSARASGASIFVVLRFVVMPIARPMLLAGTAYTLAISIREVSATILLYRPGHELLSVYLWLFWQDGELGRLAALSLCMTTVTSALLLISYRALWTAPDFHLRA